MGEGTAACKTPWEKAMGEIPLHLEYFNGTMFEALEVIAHKYPDNVALDFCGRSISYKRLLSDIRKCARALYGLGVREHDRVTIALPNCPQAVYIFYAVNLVGGIANMIHPLSAEKEIEFYLNDSSSKYVITLDQFYPKYEGILKNTQVRKIIVTSVSDEMSPITRIGYKFTERGRKVRIPDNALIIRWNSFMNSSASVASNYEVNHRAEDAAVILYSGGTTGITKGVLLSNYNFNTSGKQIIAANPMIGIGDTMLAAMPIFHGFGLGVCIHSWLTYGGRVILVPRFTAESYAGLILKYKCNFIAGVPTLYEALLRLPSMDKADLSFLKGVFSGGDTLSVELKKKLDNFLKLHNSPVQVREGYGMAETVTACCLTPPNTHREGSIGIPFPDTYIKIVKPDTDDELPYGEEGEIVISGPSVMCEYVNHPEETLSTLAVSRVDGMTWLHTGDLGAMDSEGFVYFKGRAKRMIVTSGYNVYPNQLENIIEAHPYVQLSCVIGVPDSYKMQKIKAFVVLAPNVDSSDIERIREELMKYCRLNIARYSLPYDIEFCKNLPLTPIGKVNYRLLEEAERNRLA